MPGEDEPLETPSSNEFKHPELRKTNDYVKDENPSHNTDVRPDEGLNHAANDSKIEVREQQSISRKASTKSHAQDSERMAGTFPDEDSASVYSTSTRDDQDITSSEQSVEEQRLHVPGRKSAENESEKGPENSPSQETTEEYRARSSSTLLARKGSYEGAQLIQSHSSEDSEVPAEKPVEAKPSQPSLPELDNNSERHSRKASVQVLPREVQALRPAGENESKVEPRADDAAGREASEASEPHEELVAAAAVAEKYHTREPSHEGFEQPLVMKEEDPVARVERNLPKGSDPAAVTSVGDGIATAHEKRNGLLSADKKETDVDAASSGESETPSDGTSHPRPRIEDVLERVSVPEKQTQKHPSISDRRSSRIAKKVTLATPKIFIQSPSDHTDQDLTEPHPTPTPEPKPSDEYRIVSRHGSIVSVQHTVGSATEKLNQPRLKRRKLYLRKARNAVARPIFLNAALGRRVGRRTKDRLRNLARGEQVQGTSIKTQASSPDAPRVRKSQSFVRKARSLVARKSLMDLALGREVSSDTRPVLRQMASGQFRFAEDEDEDEDAEAAA